MELFLRSYRCIVLAPSTVSLASVKAYREYILRTSAEGFSVASNFFLDAAPSCDLQSMAGPLDNVAEAELFRMAVYIDSIEHLSLFYGIWPTRPVDMRNSSNRGNKLAFSGGTSNGCITICTSGIRLTDVPLSTGKLFCTFMSKNY